MNFEQIKLQLNLDDSFDVFTERFSLSQEGFEGVKPEFLNPVAIEESCRTLKMSQEIIDAVVSAAGDIPDNTAVWALARHCHWLLFKQKDMPDTKPWPMLPGFEGKPWAEMFYAFVFLSGVDYIYELNDSRGIEGDITYHTLCDLEVWIREHHNRFGRFGLSEQGWLKKHFKGQVYSLGRLQFELGQFEFDFHLFENSKMDVIILAGDQMEFRDDGQFNGTNDIYSDTPWRSEYSCNGVTVAGNQIDERGNAAQQKVTLELQEWTQVLQKGDNICKVHIPASGPLKPELCEHSLSQANEFFRVHFADFTPKVFTCDSWLLDAQLADYLKSDSNIIKFQSLFHLYPLANSNDHQIMERVFGKRPEDLAQAPQNNSLQKAVIQHIQNGKYWHLSGGLIEA